MLDSLHPALVLLCGGLGLLAIKGSVRSWLLVLLPILSYAHFFLHFPIGTEWTVQAAGLDLQILYVDKMSFLFVTLFHLAALLASIYAMHVEDPVQHGTGLMYAGSAIGAVLAGDLFTLFVFWELLAITSVFQIWARRTESAYASGMRYLLIHVTSGVLLLAGAVVIYAQTGDLSLRSLTPMAGVGTWLVFIGVGIKCCFPFAHVWLVDAYPEATPTGTVFLSAFTTKTAVYALARLFAGEELLVIIGATMAMFPIYYAVIENDLRRVLGYSMINQIGFMVVGIGIGTDLAVNGAVAHAFNDVIFKGLLFMTMGAVLHRVGHVNGSDLGHLRKSMPFTAACCIVGAASISAFPLFSGFVSKSMVMAGAAYNGWVWVWLILLFASAGVFHHAGIKIPFFAFFGHDHGLRVEKPPLNMRVAMGLAAVACVVLGFPWPGGPLLYDYLPYGVGDWMVYDVTHVSTQIQVLCWSALAFTLLMVSGIYPPELRSVNLDADWIYRRGAKVVARTTQWATALAWQAGWEQWVQLWRLLVARLRRLHKPPGILGEPWPTGSTALWAAVVLGATLLMAAL